jgi:hypothetical protein
MLVDFAHTPSETLIIRPPEFFNHLILAEITIWKSQVFTIDGQKWDASTWKKVLMLEEPKWGIDVPSYRSWGYSPTFGSLILFFFAKVRPEVFI